MATRGHARAANHPDTRARPKTVDGLDRGDRRRAHRRSRVHRRDPRCAEARETAGLRRLLRRARDHGGPERGPCADGPARRARRSADLGTLERASQVHSESAARGPLRVARAIRLRRARCVEAPCPRRAGGDRRSLRGTLRHLCARSRRRRASHREHALQRRQLASMEPRALRQRHTALLRELRLRDVSHDPAALRHAQRRSLARPLPQRRRHDRDRRRRDAGRSSPARRAAANGALPRFARGSADRPRRRPRSLLARELLRRPRGRRRTQRPQRRRRVRAPRRALSEPRSGRRARAERLRLAGPWARPREARRGTRTRIRARHSRRSPPDGRRLHVGRGSTDRLGRREQRPRRARPGPRRPPQARGVRARRRPRPAALARAARRVLGRRRQQRRARDPRGVRRALERLYRARDGRRRRADGPSDGRAAEINANHGRVPHFFSMRACSAPSASRADSSAATSASRCSSSSRFAADSS